MGIETILLAATAATAVVGTVASVNQQKKSARLQQQQQTLQTRRSQRQALREAQIRRAQMSSAAMGLGAAGGSGIAGGSASLMSQFGSAAGYSGQMSGLSKGISNAQYRADLYSGLASVGGSMFTSLGGMPQLMAGLGVK